MALWWSLTYTASKLIFTAVCRVDVDLLAQQQFSREQYDARFLYLTHALFSAPTHSPTQLNKVYNPVLKTSTLSFFIVTTSSRRMWHCPALKRWQTVIWWESYRLFWIFNLVIVGTVAYKSWLYFSVPCRWKTDPNTMAESKWPPFAHKRVIQNV